MTTDDIESAWACYVECLTDAYFVSGDTKKSKSSQKQKKSHTEVIEICKDTLENLKLYRKDCIDYFVHLSKEVVTDIERQSQN